MSSCRPQLILLLILAMVMISTTQPSPAETQVVKRRAIVSDAFTRNRPQSRRGKPNSPKRIRLYRPASTTQTPTMPGVEQVQIGLTVWKLQRGRLVHSSVALSGRTAHREPLEWIARRVEADTQFHEGDRIRISIESPRTGYLYVIDREWFADGSAGETKLIFPIRGDDNRMRVGRLIDIPGRDQMPFKASPQANQAGELLTIVVSSTPLRFELSDEPIDISSAELAEFEQRWGGATERFEMEGGAGQPRTTQENQAADRQGTRQLTRDDPPPQTLFLVSPKSNDGLLFNLMLSYFK